MVMVAGTWSGVMLCLKAEGSALERKCLGDFYTGAHWSPVEKDCAGVQSELTVTLHRLSKTNITEDNVANTTMSMEMLTATSGDLSPTDVKYVAQILSNVASVPSIEPEVLRSVVLTVDTVIDTISNSENRDNLKMAPSKAVFSSRNVRRGHARTATVSPNRSLVLLDLGWVSKLPLDRLRYSAPKVETSAI
ncbi:hypothetical protein AVEN_241582-1 [Araneus ventricosus]|uniref:Uncharacterized protein n=1 Tax=Araneus ventricosus TaxID=182803 RepID=A0A4Y2H8U3_ARAVE|nr:hypothetical protein AVEN_241582-1 [Araneus ventricosus]